MNSQNSCTTAPQRFPGLVAFVSLTFLLASLLVRLMLVAATPADGGLTLSLVLRAVAVGLFFDLATLSYLLLPLALYLLLLPRRLAASPQHRWVIRFGFLVLLLVLIFDSCAEYLFFAEFGTRFNFIAIDYLIYTHEVIGNIRESYPLTAILAAIGGAALLLTWLLHRQVDRATAITFSGRYRRTGALLLLPSLVALAAVNISQTNFSANAYADELAGNGIYSLVAAFRNNELDFARYYRTEPDRQVLAHLRDLVAERNNHFLAGDGQRFTRRITAAGPEKKLNLIVVVEESLSAEYLGIFGNGLHLTPNLDRLSRQSLLFTNLYATGTRTVRGLEALTLSLPPLPGTSIVKRPDNGGFRSWAEILNAKGYDSSYIYAGYGYFDNMNDFFSGNGYRIVDRTSFSGNEISFANIWGVCDEDLFRKTIREADASYAAGRPFFSMVMTTSNHRPFTYPEGRIDIPSKSGRAGGVMYADYAIGRFIAEASRQPWFKDTVFVFIADHCAGSAGKTDIPVKRYEIPLMVYAPHQIAPGRVDTLMSQIDVAPTILGLLQMSYDSDFLGRDVLRQSDHPPRAFISTYQKVGYLTDDRLLVLGPRHYTAQYQVDRRSGTMRAEAVDPGLLDDMLAYYQGANYLYKHRLTRVR